MCLLRIQQKGPSYRALWAGGLVVLAIGLDAPTLHAESLRWHGSLGLARSFGGYQEQEMPWGGGVGAAVEFPLASALGLSLDLSELMMLEGAAPADRTIASQAPASATSASLGVRVRPFSPMTFTGFWFGTAVGGAYTGNAVRPAFGGSSGYDFRLTETWTGGPMLAYHHIVQPDSKLRPDDARVMCFGLHVSTGASALVVDVDTDRDGIVDRLDKCPTDPEDRDGFEDSDGCPELDNDKDKIPDTRDDCPMDPEDLDGFEDKDGCPEADNDRDNIVDAKDRCPNEPEDRDDFEDEDGCPDVDNDADGIVDVRDMCPNEPETKNGYADEDGCPDEQQVRVVGDKILLDDVVHFRVNSHLIRQASHPLLSRVAKLMMDHPEYIHIEVQGHADERGPEWFNTRLSKQRAESVMAFLVEQGVDAGRLSAEGYGEARPRKEGSKESAYFENRRVEFVVTRAQRSPKPSTKTVEGGR